MKKRTFFSLTNMLVLAVICFAVYYLLLEDNIFHASINSIIGQSQQLTLKSHLLVLGILPIYIGLVVFGAVLIVMYVRSALQQLLWPMKMNSKPTFVQPD